MTVTVRVFASWETMRKTVPTNMRMHADAHTRTSFKHHCRIQISARQNGHFGSRLDLVGKQHGRIHIRPTFLWENKRLFRCLPDILFPGRCQYTPTIRPTDRSKANQVSDQNLHRSQKMGWSVRHTGSLSHIEGSILRGHRIGRRQNVVHRGTPIYLGTPMHPYIQALYSANLCSPICM